jgi:hypothetical protein
VLPGADHLSPAMRAWRIWAVSRVRTPSSPPAHLGQPPQAWLQSWRGVQAPENKVLDNLEPTKRCTTPLVGLSGCLALPCPLLTMVGYVFRNGPQDPHHKAPHSAAPTPQSLAACAQGGGLAWATRPAPRRLGWDARNACASERLSQRRWNVFLLRRKETLGSVSPDTCRGRVRRVSDKSGLTGLSRLDELPGGRSTGCR